MVDNSVTTEPSGEAWINDMLKKDKFQTDWLAGYHQALEDAAKECERHAKFCKDEAHKGGDFQHLITRCDEATYNAERIRAMKESGL